METQQKIKVIVIGGGLSGLSAADHILTHNPKIQVTVLQALDRVGGRTLTTQIHGTEFDLGAEFIGPRQKYAIQLANRAKQQFLPVYSQGKKVLVLNGQRSTYQSLIPTNLSFLNLMQIQKILWKINRMSKKVSSLNPRDCENGAYWDSITLEYWIDSNSWFKNAKQLITAAIQVIMGCQLNQVSFLYFLWFVHQNQNFQNLVNIQNGLQQKKLKNGTQSLSIFLKEQIEKKGGKVILNQKIENILQKNKIVQLRTSDKKQYKCDYVIFASSPSVCNRINFNPSLSPQRSMLNQKSFMGKLTKIVILYDREYWKQKGYSGQIVSNTIDNPIISCFDDTKIKQNGQKQPTLIFFVGGSAYRYWKEKENLELIILNKLSQAFQCPELKKPMSISWHKFDDYPTLGGGPIGVIPPGTLTNISNLRKPQGLIHFAGTQLATCSIGYMDGAIQSGIRAAKQVLQRIEYPLETVKQIQTLQMKELNDKWYERAIRGIRKYFQWL